MTTRHSLLKRLPVLSAGVVSSFGLIACSTSPRANDSSETTQIAEPARIGRMIDRWHEAAAEADGAAYFGLMTPDSVFLGTDATERWDRAAFEAFAEPYFSEGRGWRYEPIERFILVSDNGRTAWWDERLMNAGLGECRGTGVAVLTDDGDWLIAHFSLTIPIPNAIARDVASQIGQLGEQDRESP